MFVDDLREKIKGKGVRIVFTEGPDNRVQEAAVRLQREGILNPILLGDKDEIAATAKLYSHDLSGIKIMCPGIKIGSLRRKNSYSVKESRGKR